MRRKSRSASSRSSAATGYQTEAEKAETAAKAPPPVTAGQPPPKPIQTYLNPGYAVTDDSPAACITWNDAVAYCQWLSASKRKQRIACRPKRSGNTPAGPGRRRSIRLATTTASWIKYGWYNKNAGGKSHPVGTKLPNGFGLFDMHGNLYEWCGDFYDEKWYEKSSPNDPNGPAAGSDRVIRGGTWTSTLPTVALRIATTTRRRTVNYLRLSLRAGARRGDDSSGDRRRAVNAASHASRHSTARTAARQSPVRRRAGQGPSRSLGQASGHDRSKRPTASARR